MNAEWYYLLLLHKDEKVNQADGGAAGSAKEPHFSCDVGYDIWRFFNNLQVPPTPT